MALQDLVFLLLITVIIYGVQSTSIPDDFRPDLEEGYFPVSNWIDHNPDGFLRASVRNFKKGSSCTRVVAFNVRGSVLEYLKRRCNTPRSLLGLVTINNVLHYYSKAILRRETGNDFALIIKSDSDETCRKAIYTVQTTEGHQSSAERPIVKFKEESTLTSSDRECLSLHQKTNLNTILLSTSDDVLGYKKKGHWNTYNLWEPLGVKTIRYTKDLECFQLLTLVSYGLPLDSVRVSCWTTQGVSMESDSLFYGNAVMITPRSEKLSFNVVLNHPDGHCIKRSFAFHMKNGKAVKENIRTDIIYKVESDPVCQQLVSRRTIKHEGLPTDLIRNLDKYLEPAQKKDLKDYKAVSLWNDVNLKQTMGILTRFYENEKKECKMAVVVIYRTIPLDGLFMTCGALQGLVIRGDNLYINNQLSVRMDGSYFHVLVNKDYKFCIRSVSRIFMNDGRLESEDSSSETVSLTSKDCKELIEGKYLINPEASKNVGDIIGPGDNPISFLARTT